MIEGATGILEKKVRFKCHKCNELTFGFTGTKRVRLELCKRCFGKKKDRRPKELNDLSGADWAKFSLSVQQYPDNRSEKQRKHGACFPESLAAQYILKYTKRGNVVLDPFIGVGTTLDVCIKLRRSCFGADINSSFCKIARESIPSSNPYRYSVRTCDAESINKYIQNESIDFVITSPPYASLLKSVNRAFAYKWKEHSNLSSIVNPRPYTKNKNDLGNMTYEDFLFKLERIMSNLYNVLKRRKYMAWVVKDYRDMKNGMPYISFHSDVINCATKTNFLLWDIIIYDQTKFRPLVCLGYPSSRYYHNIGHSYILIFRKGSD
jgi:DNA modification methylase